jgi:broad specificity phosphatase PhoE
MNRLYFVRHGENPANISKEFSYKLVDYSLTPKGILQAQQTAKYFENIKIDGIYTSPLKRAMETAEIIAAPLGMKPVVMENFREVNVGELEKMPPSSEAWALHNGIIERWLHGELEAAFPGGENYHSLWERMRSGIEQIIAGRDNQNLIVVGHGGIFYFPLKDLCPEVDLGQIDISANHNCSVSEILIDKRDGRLAGKVVTWASVEHLSGEATDFVIPVPDDVVPLTSLLSRISANKR